jgi:hypothetical protein
MAFLSAAVKIFQTRRAGDSSGKRPEKAKELAVRWTAVPWRWKEIQQIWA